MRRSSRNDRRLVTSALTASFLACASCAPHPAPARPAVKEICAPVPPCPSWVQAFKENRATLHVYVFDGVSTTVACTKGQTLHATVYLDEQAIGVADVPCLDAAKTPPAAYRVEGGKVGPGLHELHVDVQTPRGLIHGATLLSLPAFDMPTDGRGVVFGAEVAVGLGPDDIAIGAPQVYAPSGF
ncbi:MAG: hypothetical protein JWO86_8934 [Myxococcaceae bacterium]|nr:hypothetical protein [Myxococcaceae bacterium]